MDRPQYFVLNGLVRSVVDTCYLLIHVSTFTHCEDVEVLANLTVGMSPSLGYSYNLVTTCSGHG